MGNLAEKLPEEFEERSLTLYEKAITLKVVDQDTFAAAGEVGKDLKSMQKVIEDHYKPIKQAQDAAKKVILDKEKSDLSPVLEALDTLRKSMNVYLQEQERIRQEEERKARLAAEEAARKEQERLLAQAAKAEEKGKEEKVEALLERAENVYVAPVVVETKVETAKFDGGAVGQVKEIQITVTDLKAFLAEIVKRGMAPTMIEVKVAPLKAWQKANDIKSFPGLNIVETMAARIR